MKMYLTLIIFLCILDATEDEDLLSIARKATTMTTSQIGIDLIQSFESFREVAYQDSTGIWTVGWGTTYINGHKVVESDRMTKEQANLQFRGDLTRFEGYVKKYIHVPLNQNQFDAVVSLCYNIGQGNLKQSSVIRHLNNYNYGLAGDCFLMWDKAKNRETGELRTLRGLTRRREVEKQLFMLS